MTRFPGADMIVDVARAANPVRQQAAARRLSELAAPGAASRPFTSELSAVASESARAAPIHNTHSPLIKVQNASDGGIPTARKASRQFEAFVLQTFIEQVLPSEKTGLFGDEAAGGIWRSLMAEQISATFAKAGGVGLAKLLETQLAKHAAEQSNDAATRVKKATGA